MRRRGSEAERLLKYRNRDLDRATVKLSELRERIDNLAKQHAPVAGTRLATITRNAGQSSADTSLVWCKECRSPWPCRTYLWATESEPFHLVIRESQESSLRAWGQS